MELTVTPDAYPVASGAVAAIAYLVARRRRFGRWGGHAIYFFNVFLTGGMIPPAFLLIFYPFLEPKPNLDDYLLYLPLAGLGALLVFGLSFKAAIAEDNPANQS
ncbi:MAG: hypothetical protein ACE5FK_05560 [Candidatus Methylomirabilia bacterium]